MMTVVPVPKHFLICYLRKNMAMEWPLTVLKPTNKSSSYLHEYHYSSMYYEFKKIPHLGSMAILQNNTIVITNS